MRSFRNLEKISEVLEISGIFQEYQEFMTDKY
jgi:hypothetical protein